MGETAPGLTHVELTGTVFPNLALKVGGHLLPFARLEFDSGNGETAPELTITLPVYEGSVWTLEARCSLEETTRDALVAMGWTPPADCREPAPRYDTAATGLPEPAIGAIVQASSPDGLVYYRVASRTQTGIGEYSCDLEPLDAAAVQAIVSPA